MNLLVRKNLDNPRLWVLFGFYAAVVALAQWYHEPWGDELQTWGLIKNSGTLKELISNSSVDGHPPLWYLVVFMFSQISHSFHTLQFAAFFFSMTVVFLFIFYSGFPLKAKVLVLCGYYFLFEYALFGRNYFIILLISFLICINLKATWRYKNLVYYVLLFCLCNTHFFAMWLAIAFHAYFLVSYKERTGLRDFPLKHVVAGALVLLLFFIITLLVSSIGEGSSWMLNKWDAGRITMAAQVPLRAFLPIPPWWLHHFWNKNMFWDGAGDSIFLKLIALGISAAALAAGCYVFLKNRTTFVFFGTLVSLMFLNAVLFPVTNARYTGLMYMAFLIGLWLKGGPLFSDPLRRKMIYALLVLQIPGGMIALVKDFKYPFSQIYKTEEIVGLVPEDNRLITDFWSLVYLNAVNHKSYYCVESKKEQTFLRGGEDWFKNLNDPHRYTYGVTWFFEKNKMSEVFFLCNFSPLMLHRYDTYFYKTFEVSLAAARVGALEPYSDLYLYRIRQRDYK